MDFRGNPSLLIFVYIRFPETPDFRRFPFPENSGLLWTPVDWFLRVPCYSGMFVFRDIQHMYYVPLSLVNLSAVNSFTFLGLHSSPFALPYCSRLCLLRSLLVSRSGSPNH